MIENEIVYCDLTVKHKGKPLTLKNVVYKHTDGYFYRKRILKEPAKVISVKVHLSLGFAINGNSFTNVKKSSEERNKISGAYD